MLRVAGLRVAYGQREVLTGVDLTVGTGEVVGLVGPNGCGKTTLLRAITRVVPWVSGEVEIGGPSASSGHGPSTSSGRGRAVSALSTRELARLVAVVPQSPVLPVGYTAEEVVLMGRTPHLGFLAQEGPRDYERAREALARVGAEDLASRRVDELSGGERQSVVLARALAQDAPVLLLDEPTANLDIGHQIRVARLVRELAKTEGLAVLAAVHDLTLASLYCDRLALMAGGRVVATGLPADVLNADNLRAAYGVDATILRVDRPATPIVLPLAIDPQEPG